MNLKDKLLGLRAVWAFDNRWQLIVNRILFTANPSLLYRLGKIEFLVDHSAGDASGTRLCVTTDLYRRFLPDMKLPKSIKLLDLGANGGGFPLMFLFEGYDIAKLVCVEMNPNTFRRLEFNIHRNVRGDTHLVHGALCDERKELQLTLGAGTTSDSIYQQPSQADGASAYRIRGYTFDELVEDHFGGDEIVDICKMDVEGAEYEVFASGSHTQLRRCRYLIAEFHSNGDPQRLIDQLASLGFTEIRDPSEPTTAEHLFANTVLT